MQGRPPVAIVETGYRLAFLALTGRRPVTTDRRLFLFEAAGPDLVRSVNDVAQFPLARVMAVPSSVPDETGPAP
jgi:hypothetical protein